MGTRYSSNSASGYNATPPADDGTVSEANKVKWSTAKTKLADPIKDLADVINTDLVAHFDRGPTALTSNTTLGATHFNEFIQASGSGVTLTLTDASTLTAGWYTDVINTDASNTISIARATAADTINASSNDVALLPLQAARIFVNAAATGFIVRDFPNFRRQNVSATHVNNLTFTATVAASALTIALKGLDGNDPSLANPIEIAFRNATAGTGDYTVSRITAATSVVVSSGSTLGTTSGEAHRLWVVGFNDGGTFRLGVINASTTSNIFRLADDILASSSAEGGAGAADSAGVIYTDSAVTTKAMRVLGYIESTQATAGTWATTPSKSQPWTTGMKLPGDLVQVAYNQTGATSNGATTIPLDDTIPQNTEGDEKLTQAITPTSAINMLEIQHVGQYACNVTSVMTTALFQDSTANALAATLGVVGVSADFPTNLTLLHRMRAGTTSATTFKIRSGITTGTLTFNGNNAARLMGGVMASSLIVREIMC